MKRATLACLFASLAVSSAARGAPANLAPGRPVTGSSEGWGTVFEDAVDANRDGEYGNGSVWHSTGHPEENPPTFYEVDLGADYYLDRVQILPRNIRQTSVRNFRLTALDSANVQVYSQDFFTGPDQSTDDAAWGTNTVRNVFGRTLRILRLSQDPAPLSFMTFAEFEVYGQSTPIQPNLATAGSITANTGGGFGTALEDAIDGDIDGHYGHVDGIGSSHPIFHADSNRGDEYWQLDLGAAYDLDYLNLFSRSDFTGNTSNVRLDILASDGVSVVHTQNLQMQGVDFGGPRYDQTVDLTSVAGQFIRLTALEGGGDLFLALAEVEAFAVVIPEPNALALSAIGLLLAACRYRRRRR